MKHLYLLRHAKSSWDDPTLADSERPLAPRGERAGKKLAKHIERENIRPALVLCSSARRTRDTLQRIAAVLGRADVRIEDDLYAASERELLARLRSVPDSVDSVMVIAHNPGLQDLVLTLGGESAAPLAEGFPTGALATLAVPSWSELGHGSAELVAYVVPRDLA